MQIGELSRISGLSIDTIRFYEKKGLIQVKRTQSEWNNYRDFEDEHVRKLALIKKCKGFGFTLNEIGEVLRLVDEESATCLVVSELADRKVRELDARIKELEQIKSIILEKFDMQANNCGMTNINENCVELE